MLSKLTSGYHIIKKDPWKYTSAKSSYGLLFKMCFPPQSTTLVGTMTISLTLPGGIWFISHMETDYPQDFVVSSIYLGIPAWFLEIGCDRSEYPNSQPVAWKQVC